MVTPKCHPTLGDFFFDPTLGRVQPRKKGQESKNITKCLTLERGGHEIFILLAKKRQVSKETSTRVSKTPSVQDTWIKILKKKRHKCLKRKSCQMSVLLSV